VTAPVIAAPGELPKRLNLGCGHKLLAGCLNVDYNASLEPDLVLDLDRRPYPLPRNHFEHVYAFDVVEHLADVAGFMEEVHAILAPGGVLEITTPHFSSANSFTDPTHRHHLSYFSFDYFTDGHPWNFYSAVRYTVAERVLVFPQGLVARLVARLANRRPEIYERRFAWIFPAWFIIVKLRAVKEHASGGTPG
jgi:SAM-dependent methyltransferase